MNPSLHPPSLALGLDVGGTKIAAGVVQFPEGRVVSRRIIPTRAERGGQAVLNDVLALSRELIAQLPTDQGKIEAVGLGLCELVDPKGRILSANCVPWQNQPVLEELARLAPAVIEADVRAAAMAEARFGVGKPFRIFLYVTVGTGIASCLMLEGRPFTGARGITGTMASSPLTVVCQHCGRITGQTLEAMASGPALASRLDKLQPGLLRTGQEVLAAANAGDPHALEIVRSAGETLGSTVALLVNVLDPETVILGGGLGLSDGLYWDSFVDATRRHLWSEVHRDLPILRAVTGTDAGWIGAALAAWQRSMERR